MGKKGTVHEDVCVHQMCFLGLMRSEIFSTPCVHFQSDMLSLCSCLSRETLEGERKINKSNFSPTTYAWRQDAMTSTAKTLTLETDYERSEINY